MIEREWREREREREREGEGGRFKGGRGSLQEPLTRESDAIRESPALRVECQGVRGQRPVPILILNIRIVKLTNIRV